MDYIIHIIILIGIYTILSISLNLLVGYTGILSLAHAAFFGVGAYTSALLALKFNGPFFINIFIVLFTSALFGAIVGMPSLRIKGDLFIIATFAFQIFFFSIINNWDTLTEGPAGLSGIPRPVIFGVVVSTTYGFLLLISFFCLVIMLIDFRITRSPFGRVLKAIREDELFTQAVGKNVAVYKVLIFAIGASMAAIAGAMYAHYISFIDPSSFTVMESIFIISIVIIGGAGSLWGPVVGAILLVALPELLRFIGLPNSIVANFRQIFYGALLVVFMMWRPQGLLGKYAFRSEGPK
jgi:branched-chain amino acid transport system permease protein